MASVEEAREQVIAYEQGVAEAQEELEAFKAANGDSLGAIKDEFADYQRHPLWLELSEKHASADQPAQNYGEWYYQNLVCEENPAPDFSWQGKVLFSGTPGGYGHKGHRVLSPGNPDASILPLGVEEFDRRATIAEHIGEVAMMLRKHRNEPIVSLASYSSDLRFKRINEDEDDYSFSYTYGKVIQLPKTRVIVGSIGRPGEHPRFAEAEPESSSEGDQKQALRLKLADSVAGMISAYSLPASKRQLKRQTISPSHRKNRMVSEGYKYKDLPIGNSVIGSFPLEQLRGHDLLTIDGPHRTAADHEFSDDIALYRPKQKIEVDSQSRDQEIAVTPGQNTKVYETTLISEDHEVTLPSLRHDTIWLVGAKSIEANLAGTIWDLADLTAQNRGTHWAILDATRDLVKFASNGQTAAELAA